MTEVLDTKGMGRSQLRVAFPEACQFPPDPLEVPIHI